MRCTFALPDSDSALFRAWKWLKRCSLCAHTGIFRCSAPQSGRSIPLCGRSFHERLWQTSSSADRRGTCDASRNAPDNSSCQPRRRPYVQPSGPVQRISLRSPLLSTPRVAVAMFAPLAFLANLASEAMLIVASPAQRPLDSAALQRHDRFFDVQVSRDNLLDNLRTHHSLAVAGTPRWSREHR